MKSVHTCPYLPSLISFCLLRNQSGILYWRGLFIMVTIFSTWSNRNSNRVAKHKLCDTVSLDTNRRGLQSLLLKWLKTVKLIVIQKDYNLLIGDYCAHVFAGKKNHFNKICLCPSFPRASSHWWSSWLNIGQLLLHIFKLQHGSATARICAFIMIELSLLTPGYHVDT